MTEMIAWTRPAWLLALPFGLALAWLWWRSQAGTRVWRGLVDPELLAHLAGGARATSAHLAFAAGAGVLVLVCVALAGPVWQPQSVAQRGEVAGRIVVLDLSASMDAIDVQPSRLHLGREAAAALLREAAGAQLGLVVFGADAFTVAPLTTDAAALLHLLPGVNTATLPRAGSRPDLGIDLARALLKQRDIAAADVILIGDSAGDARALDAARALAHAGFSLSVIAVGTAQGGPVPLRGGALAKTDTGEIVIARPEVGALERLSRAGGGRFHFLADQHDLKRFAMRGPAAREPQAAGSRPGAPRDLGPWLALLALPLAALLARRGWLACWAALAFALPAPHAEAFDWGALWRRPDQQAAAAFRAAQAQEYERVLEKLSADSPWHAMLLYRSGRYAEAASQFAAQDTAQAHYNRGNALAHDGELEAAIAAYDAALARNPSMQDALANRKLVREALARLATDPAEVDDTQVQDRKRRRSSSSKRPGGIAGGPGEPTEGRAGDGPDVPRGGKGASAAEAGEGFGEVPRQAQDPRTAEMRRLEGLLSQVDDDSGSLLANRFARQLQTRGAPHRDTGARW